MAVVGLAVDRVEKKMHLTGRHDVDQGWLTEVRNVDENSTAPLIVPRFMFHGWLLEDYQHLFSEQSLVSQLITLLARECVYVMLFFHSGYLTSPHNSPFARHRSQNFDGLVLEHSFVLNTQISSFIIGLANELHELNKKIILVVPVMIPFCFYNKQQAGSLNNAGG